MTLIVASLLVIVSVDGSSSTRASLRHSLVTEAAAIWKSAGVAVQESPCAPLDGPTREVHVVLTNDHQKRNDGERLGWINFRADTPESVIYLSPAAALDLLDSSARLREQPDALREQLLGRVLGRALAHELGHYLYASKQHTRDGLMRAHWSTYALVAAERPGLARRP